MTLIACENGNVQGERLDADDEEVPQRRLRAAAVDRAGHAGAGEDRVDREGEDERAAEDEQRDPDVGLLVDQLHADDVERCGSSQRSFVGAVRIGGRRRRRAGSVRTMSCCSDTGATSRPACGEALAVGRASSAPSTVTEVDAAQALAVDDLAARDEGVDRGGVADDVRGAVADGIRRPRP